MHCPPFQNGGSLCIGNFQSRFLPASKTLAKQEVSVTLQFVVFLEVHLLEQMERPKQGKDKKAKRKIRKNAHSSKNAYELSESEGLMNLPLEILHLIIDVLDHDFASLWILRCVCRTFHDLINSFPVLGKVPQQL